MQWIKMRKTFRMMKFRILLIAVFIIKNIFLNHSAWFVVVRYFPFFASICSSQVYRGCQRYSILLHLFHHGDDVGFAICIFYSFSPLSTLLVLILKHCCTVLDVASIRKNSVYFFTLTCTSAAEPRTLQNQFIYELRSNVITCIWDGGPNMEEHDTSRFHLEFKII